jgi:hypothetical protein
VLELLNGLIKHPDEREDSTTAAGIFTRCVRHCAENNMRCKMSRIHELAQSLELDGSPERRTYAGTGDSKHDSVASEPMDNADDEANNVAEMDEV